MVSIFLSYRRDDSAGYTGRIHDRFAEKWGHERVFWDIDNIEPGADFVEVIDETLAQCAAVVVVIGPRWLGSQDAAGRRRLDNPADLHRVEIERALQRGIRVIPALVGRATMPGDGQLPATMRALARRNAVELSDKRFNFDIGKLTEFIDGFLVDFEAATQRTAEDVLRRGGIDESMTRRRSESEDDGLEQKARHEVATDSKLASTEIVFNEASSVRTPEKEGGPLVGNSLLARVHGHWVEMDDAVRFTGYVVFSASIAIILMSILYAFGFRL